MKTRKVIDKIMAQVLAQAYEGDFKILRDELTDNYEEYSDEVDAILDKHNDIKERDGAVIKETYTQLTSLFENFLEANSSSRADLAAAYTYFIHIFRDPMWEEELRQYGIETHTHWVFSRVKDFNIILTLYAVSIGYDTDCLIRYMGELSKNFFNDIDDVDSITKEQISNLQEEFLSIFTTYIHKQLDLYNKIEAEFYNEASFVLLKSDKFMESIKFAYDNLMFYLNHYCIHLGFKKLELSFEHERILRLLSEEDLDDLLKELAVIIQSYEVQDTDIFESLMKAANRFYEHTNDRIYIAVLADAVREQMVEVLTDFVYAQYPDGDINTLVTAISSFVFLYEHVNISKVNLSSECTDELEMDEIYRYLYQDGVEEAEADKFKDYLECIREVKMDEAISLYDEYEYPHYYKVLKFMSMIHENNTGSDGDITYEEASEQALDQELDLYNMPKEEWLTIGEHIAHLKDLESVLVGKRVIKGLPDLNAGYEDFILKVFGAPLEKSPMARFYSYFIQIVKLVVSGIKQQEKIEALNKSLQEALQAQGDMVRNYSHAWKHVVYPGVVKDIALNLVTDLESEDINLEEIRQRHSEYSAKLMKAYRSENVLKRQGEMLVLKHSANNVVLQQSIRSDILRPSSSERGLLMEEILAESLEILIFGLIMRDEDATNTDKGLRKLLFSEGELQLLREDFSRKFVLNKEEANIFRWFSKHIYPMEIAEFDSNWKGIKLVAGGNAAVFFIDIFTELFYNALKHGEKSKDKAYIKLYFSTVETEDGQFLELKMENAQGNFTEKSWGSGAGLKAMNRLLSKINEENYSGKDYLLHHGDGEKYLTKLYLIKSMFVKKELRL